MTKYPNREALRKAHDIYLDAMRPFIIRCLKRIQGRTLEDLIRDVSDYEPNDDIEALIDVNNIPRLVRNHWHDIFSKEFNSDLNVQNTTWLIVEGRNLWAHPGKEDVDPESTRMYLTLTARVLGEIKNQEAKQTVESVRNKLFADKERLADMAKQLEAAKAENTELEKQVKTKSDRLEEFEAEWIASEERLETVSTQLKIAVAGKTVAEERLSDISNRLEEAERENAAYKKRIETIPDQLETANTEKVKYDKVLKAASNQLATLKTVNTQLEERLEIKSVQLEEVEEELADCKERLVQFKRLPLNPNTPDSVTFQGTTFTKHLNEYHVEGDDISQSFWHYWQSQGREGKQEMRDAGWSVEKVDGDWEVTISPVDFQAWIENEVTELSSLINFSRDEESSTQSIRPSYEKISLPTVREMEQPALRVLADGKEHRRVEIIDYLTEHFSLADNERSYLSKTGQSEKHLMSEGLIERTRTGYYRITARGRRKVRTT